MTNAQRALNALADPTRRLVLERLSSGPAVSQHLRALKQAGLVTDTARGTRRVYQIDPAGLGAVRAWLDQFWATSLDAFRAEAEAPRGARPEEGEG